ncbi:unnamed protein product [marine sediment metagenome]|uniref:Uncharacterized protein n=1 Tax=marine sediment metagenome TaxID=412755 RepID=X1RWZ3_9ZZZZ
MFKKVSIKEIKNIRERLESELKFEEDLPYRRREEIKSLICYLNTWLEWKEYRERKHYKEVIESES